MASQQNVQCYQHTLPLCIWGHEIEHRPTDPPLREVTGWRGDNAYTVKIMSHDGKCDCYKEGAG